VMNSWSTCKHNKPLAEQAASLYVHVPFCRAKCRYCDFYSLVPAPGQAEAFVEGVAIELDYYSQRLQHPLETVFIGGGTPTSLPLPLLERLLATVGKYVNRSTEFSVEANPSTVTASTAELLRAAGVNRVNIGAQSFLNADLAAISRIHTPDQARRAVGFCRRAGIENVGLDLIYGLPGQTPATWQYSLAAALALAPAHLSCYALSYEPHTPLADDLARGKVAEMNEDDQRKCYYAAIDAATDAGLEHYEISNFARPGFRCRHNLTYWENRPYVGLGPAAASYLHGVRRTNTPDLQAWIAAMRRRQPAPASQETLNRRASMAETVMLSLRLAEGIDRKLFAWRFGEDVVNAFHQPVSRYHSQGALEVSPSHLRLTRQAMFVADTVLADIIAAVD